ncbi:hypothetical protein ABMC89_14350 [Sulfitobacter sp. HNIBRBA3233]|uniref:hypothetical protein n=1 Tax=Sulfitobacter marinivivus TaxID=3158558 RepID=UPI0032DF677B
MLSFFKNPLKTSLARIALAGVTCFGLMAGASAAQQTAQGQGAAFGVDLVQAASRLSMRDSYSRGLYLYMRSNPSMLDNQEFYVNFLIYLMTTSDRFNCTNAFANEFERRDYFTQAFSLKEQLRSAVNSVWIPQRFDIGYSIDTGRYDFTTGDLPFSNIRSVGLRQVLSGSLQPDRNAQGCARQILQGTTVTTEAFPWQFSVVNEEAKRNAPQFPFGGSLNLSQQDARAVFDRFGRQLFAIVGYQFQAANNGERIVQIIPTDGQLFGLSKDAVVRVKTFEHPTLSMVQSLDVTNPMKITIPEYNIDMQMLFQQQGFRAVGTGTRKVAGSGITSGSSFPVTGSAAVGNSVFVMRLETEGLEVDRRRLENLPNGERYLTIFGSIDREKVTSDFAPVSGQAIVLQRNPQTGELQQTSPVSFGGGFTPKGAAEPSQPKEPASQLDTSPVIAPSFSEATE